MIELRQADFIDRNNFADFLNRRNLISSAVEVGTHRATFAQIFMQNWHVNGHLYCVDPYQDTPLDYLPQVPLLEDCDGDRRKDLTMARRRLKPYMSRVDFLLRESVVAVDAFKDESLDFVYIDADHREEVVYKDLTVWYNKVKSGGVLAGHDFLQHHPDDKDQAVQQAVLRFSVEKGLPVYLVVEPTCSPWSFLFEKP